MDPNASDNPFWRSAAGGRDLAVPPSAQAGHNLIRKVQSFIAVDEGTQKCLTEELLDAAYQCPPKLMPSLPENHPLLHLEVSEMKLATKIWIEAAVQDVENLKEFGQAVMNQSDALHGVVGHLITKLYEQQDAIALLKDELQATKIQSPAALVEEKVKDEPPMTTEKFERELASIEEDAAKKVKKDADVGFAEGVHLLMCKMAHLKDAVTNSSLSRMLAEKVPRFSTNTNCTRTLTHRSSTLMIQHSPGSTNYLYIIQTN